jgi:CheY-like chemotaxis protein
MHDKVEILLVEDNEFDVEAVKRAFRKAEID